MRKKIKIDWDGMLRDRSTSPSPELSVVPAVGGGGGDAAPWEEEEEEEDPVSKLPDSEIQEQIQRLLKQITSGIMSKLKDGGEKLRSLLRKLQKELDSRKLVHSKKGAGDCATFKQSKTKDSTDSYVNSSLGFITSMSHSKSSKTCRFSGKLDDKPGAVLNDNSRPMFDRNKCDVLRESRWLIHERFGESEKSSQEVTTSSNYSPFRSGSSFTCKERKRSFNDCCSDIKFPCFASHGGGNSSCRPWRSGIASENKDTVDSKSKKVKVLVLLDGEESEDMQHMQSDDLPVTWKEAKIYYPSREDPNCVELSYYDIKCLEPESYLSSTIMNFYTKYLQGRLLPTSRLQGGCYFFNTYFFKKLEDAVFSKGDRNTCFLKLRRWWKDIDIFQKKYIFLPVHMRLHWSLLIICIPAKEENSGPILLHLDSLGLHDSGLIFEVIYRFIIEEWKYLNETALPSDPPLSDAIWEELPQKIERKIVEVPQQENEYDCGVFVLYYIKRWIKDAPERLRKKDLAAFGSEWFKPKKASSLRGRIRKLLIKEFEIAMSNNGSTSLSSTSCSSP